MVVAAADPWWADWPKFIPGWLAFVWTLGAGARKLWLRRHQLALGPEAEELRKQLTAFRALLDDVASGSHRSDWFMHEDRRETSRALQDAAGRRDDPALKLSLNRLADAWNEVFALAPPPRTKLRFLGGIEEVRQQRDVASQEARYMERIAQMCELAQTAKIDVQSALSRLNELERKTHGRS
ncbi:hypothetical protein CP966_20240 [Streptomyces galilaeus]|uniref:hypothetical protein n=1 Tax=Streptomyces galilaeus TaxID=33899 RepID=UPI00123DDA9D|nr:hypothetical protein [Streptomyces galilaeus]QEU67308.1 hypothetical protein CP966_20240 [Streptomyces galilaeus]GGW45038.1 hypothetical protein GCM10010350_31180 [Streptomyces galilaeus]